MFSRACFGVGKSEAQLWVGRNHFPVVENKK